MIKSSKINNLINNFKNNKLSHAFLIETDDYAQTISDVIELIKVLNCPETFKEDCNNCNICRLISNQIFPNLHIIEPDGQAIKKEQILNLKKEMKAIPFISKYNIYIIKEAEKLNASSANSMLKFIEEPEDNIIGFFITNNKENIINTVKSRCEIIKVLYNDLNKDDLEIYKTNYPNIYEEAINYLNFIENSKVKSILYNKKILEKNYEREEISLMFKIILAIYNAFINDELISNDIKLACSNKKEILKKINLVIDIVDKLNYNTNLNLILDYFIIELGV